MTVRSDRLRNSTFAIPALLAVACAGGLVAALVGDELFDILGWLGLCAPITAIVLSVRRSQSSPASGSRQSRGT